MGSINIDARDGRRSSTAVAYLKPARRKSNLSVKTGCRVLRIIVEQGRALGVEYSQNGRASIVRAEREVIVSAGSINTPKLLMLSGIGPADHLDRMECRLFKICPGWDRIYMGPY